MTELKHNTKRGRVEWTGWQIGNGNMGKLKLKLADCYKYKHRMRAWEMGGTGLGGYYWKYQAGS